MTRSQGIKPRLPRREPGFGLSGAEPAEVAVRRMALTMSDHARLYEAGIIDDLDTEFVHQFRVSLRKARSLITLMKGVFDPQVYHRLKATAGDLVRPTGAVRDLDVFLLERERYAAMLPPGFETGVEHLFAAIAADRARAQAALVRRLHSKAHARAAHRLQAALQQPAALQTSAASRPIGKLARKQILKHHHKLIALGSATDDQTPDEDIHKLRIEGKKSRYLIEFFQELFEKRETRPLLSELKRLQDILGQFNDYAVQQQFLLHYNREKGASRELVAAVGGLATVLHQQQMHARGQVRAAFERFGSKHNQAAFERVFTSQR